MATQLHIRTRLADELVETIRAAQRARPGGTVEVADLTQPELDYAALVDKVFAAAAVATWQLAKQ